MAHNASGTGEGLVAAYFGRVGWPLSVGKGEEGIFARKVRYLSIRTVARAARPQLAF